MKKTPPPRTPRQKKPTADLARELRLLVRAQKRTEENMAALARSQQELAEAQKRTEERLDSLAVAQQELAQAQRRTEERVEALAQAQQRTEERLDRLTEQVAALAQAQRRTEERLQALAEAQRRTDETVQDLTRVVRDLAQQVGHLSDTIGFGLEDIARVVLPGYLERHLGITLEGELQRRFIPVDSQEIELNLYAEGRQNGEPIVVVGECKSRIYAGEVRGFLRTIERVRQALLPKALFFMFGYLLHPSGVEVAQRENVLLVASYQR